jgi:hypothetical protein
MAIRLAQDYPRLQIVLINDRSTDATGDIVDRLAASDARITAVHIRSLPSGWLGKVHALHEGVRHASGEWYLFTDADVYYQPGALRRAVCYAKRHHLDHLACFPEMLTLSAFWLDVTIRSFFLLLCSNARIAEVNLENSRWPIGIGAFNLVTAEAFERTPGFEWLRMEPGDDIGLGLMLKQAGARTHLVNGDGDIRVHWYESLGAMTRGLEKNSFGPAADYSYLRQLFMVLSLWGLATVPSISVISGLYLDNALLLGAGCIALLATLVTALSMPRKSVVEIFAWLLMPCGALLVSLIMLRSAWKCFRNGGIDWRGTHYPIAELRRGQRVRISPLVGQDIRSG